MARPDAKHHPPSKNEDEPQPKAPIIDVVAENSDQVEPRRLAKLVSDTDLIPRKGKRHLLGHFMRQRKAQEKKAA